MGSMTRPASLRFNYQDYLLLPESRRHEIIVSPLLPGLAIPLAQIF